MTVHIDGEILIARPIEDVFDFVADERNEPRYNPAMLKVEKLTDGPIGPGTRYHVTLMRGRRPMDMQIETTVFERPHTLSATTVLESMTIRGTLHFEPRAVGTLMRWHWEIDARGLLRYASPLVAYMGRRQEQAIWTALKLLLESEADGVDPNGS
jgi:uncharacterized protein YndB with AHSA1/START domain